MTDTSAPEQTSIEPAPPGGGPAACPFGHGGTEPVVASGGTCPIDHGARARRTVQRSRADELVRRVLRIKERPAGVSDQAAYATFRRSMLISGLRCTLTYVVFPFLLPAASFAAGVGPILGIIIGSIAMVCDVFTIRRFFEADHRWRWPVAIVATGVIGLLSVLLVQDIIHLVT